MSSLTFAQNDIKSVTAEWVISDLLVVNPLLTEEKKISDVDMLLKLWRSDESRW